MTSEITTEETPEIIPEVPEIAGNLFEREMKAFQRLIEEAGIEIAIDRYGYAMLHSLPSEEYLLHAETLGLKGKDALSLYNLGLAYAAKEDLTKAISLWKAALKQDPELCDAEFNLAVAAEKSGNATEARKRLARCLEIQTNPEEVQQIEEFLASLEG